jgi:hypothetical protein
VADVSVGATGEPMPPAVGFTSWANAAIEAVAARPAAIAKILRMYALTYYSNESPAAGLLSAVSLFRGIEETNGKRCNPRGQLTISKPCCRVPIAFVACSRPGPLPGPSEDAKMA